MCRVVNLTDILRDVYHFSSVGLVYTSHVFLTHEIKEMPLSLIFDSWVLLRIGIEAPGRVNTAERSGSFTMRALQ